jgi:hypothetical protein
MRSVTVYSKSMKLTLMTEQQIAALRSEEPEEESSTLIDTLKFLAPAVIGLAGFAILSKFFGSEDDEEVGTAKESLENLESSSVPKTQVPKAVPLDDPKEIKVKSFSVMDKVSGFFDWFRTEKRPDPTPTGSKQGSENIPAPVKIPSLGSDYRSKFAFPSSIRNAENLSKDGKYTQEEADTIVGLKTNGTNTSASFSMKSSTKEKIRNRAIAYGLDPAGMIRIAQMESGGNPNAISSTGAIGIFQMTGSTASSLGLANRFNEDANIEAGMQLASQNKKTAARTGIEETPLSIYLIHQLGPPAAKEILTAAKDPSTKITSLTPRTQKKISQNYGGKTASTASEYVKNTQQKLESYQVESQYTRPVQVSSSRETLPLVATAESNTRPRESLDISSVKNEPSPIQKPSVAMMSPKDSADNEVFSSGSSPQQNQPPKPTIFKAEQVMEGPGGLLMG